MGQVHVAWVRVKSLPEMWAALVRAGFAVTISDEPDTSCDQSARCRRGERELIVGVCIDPTERDGAYVVVAHPPYSDRPWHWGGDTRFFNDLTAVLDIFDIPAWATLAADPLYSKRPSMKTIGIRTTSECILTQPVPSMRARSGRITESPPRLIVPRCLGSNRIAE